MAKILLAEDDDALAGMYKMKFEDEGFMVARAANGEEALLMAKSEKPDIILLDVMMPKKEGTEVLIELKGDETTKNIPVIFLTNLGGRMEDTKAAQELGAEDFIVKSLVTPKDVVAKVREVLENRK